MQTLLVAFLGVLLIPLFVGTWRTSLLGLSLQGMLMTAMALSLGLPQEPGDWLTLADLFLLRGLGAPALLYLVLRSQQAPKRNDVIPPNLLSWAFALGAVFVAFRFSAVLIPIPGDEQRIVTVAIAAVLLGFLVLATQENPLTQMIGALRLENAVALFELGGPHHEASIWIQIGQILIVLATVLLYRWYLILFDRKADRMSETRESTQDATHASPGTPARTLARAPTRTMEETR